MRYEIGKKGLHFKKIPAIEWLHVLPRRQKMAITLSSSFATSRLNLIDCTH